MTITIENGKVDRSANTTPGNKKGGLAKISGVLSPGEKVRQKSLIFAATPASDFVCGTQQLASGINV